MASEMEVNIVLSLVNRKDLNVTQVRFAIDEAAEWILRYTNRAVLPPELWRIKIRIAADVLTFLTPKEGVSGDGDVMMNPTKIQIDDAIIEGDANPSPSASLGDGMRFLKNYAKQLEMWRVMPRWRRPFFEPYRRKGF